jgi:hypothetical protein
MTQNPSYHPPTDTFFHCTQAFSQDPRCVLAYSFDLIYHDLNIGSASWIHGRHFTIERESILTVQPLLNNGLFLATAQMDDVDKLLNSSRASQEIENALKDGDAFLIQIRP